MPKLARWMVGHRVCLFIFQLSSCEIFMVWPFKKRTAYDLNIIRAKPTKNPLKRNSNFAMIRSSWLLNIAQWKVEYSCYFQYILMILVQNIEWNLKDNADQKKSQITFLNLWLSVGSSNIRLLKFFFDSITYVFEMRIICVLGPCLLLSLRLP